MISVRYRIFTAIVLLALLSCAQIHAQFQSNPSLLDLLRTKSESKSEIPQVGEKVTPLDAPVNPKEYYVGPGDLLSVDIWSSAPVSNRLTVTPEGNLLIPNVGIIDVDGQTLDSLKRSVGRVVEKRYPHSDVTVTLLAPRKIIVQVTGDVLNESKIEMNSLQRVDNLIVAANTPPAAVNDPGTIIDALQRVRRGLVLRSVIVQRRTGEKIRADLLKFQITGNTRYNPYLREGDQVFVPARTGATASAIGVSGAVRLARTFEFVAGDSLSDLIRLGFGFKRTADSTHGIFSRLSPDGGVMEKKLLNPAAILHGEEPDIALQPGDHLFVDGIPDGREAFTVMVDGEVRQPGQYPITSASTKLSEIIKSAGGFTERAQVKGSTLTRARISPQSSGEEIAKEQLLSTRNSLGIQDTSYYLSETVLRLKGELVSVNFDKLFLQHDTTQDVTLRNYDRVYVPPKTGSVYVFGQVLSPGHVDFVDGKDYHYYVDKAAGYTDDADKSDIAVIKGNTRLWFDPSETKIEDGDFIWVPKTKHYPFAYYLTTVAQFAAILGTVATVALLINNFTK